MAQFSVPCSVYRGGTSRGIFFHEKDLPKDEKMMNHLFLHAIDAYNPSQINGLGSGTSHSSKIVVIGKENNELRYTFYQIGIGSPIVDDRGTCGNLMAAVGAFIVDEGLIDLDPGATEISFSVLNTNVNKIIQMNVPLVNGRAKVTGDYAMPGIVTPGAKLNVDMMDPGGAKTGKTFPLGVQTTLQEYPISFVDVVNPFVYVKAESFGLTGTESFQNVQDNVSLIDRLNDLRDEAAVAVGFAKTIDEARIKSSAVPKIAVVAEPQTYETTSGEIIKADDIDIMAKMISMGKLHRTFAGSGLYNLAASTLLAGTIPNRMTTKTHVADQGLVRIGHPDGIAVVRVSLNENRTEVISVGLERTARKIMKGNIFVPELV